MNLPAKYLKVIRFILMVSGIALCFRAYDPKSIAFLISGIGLILIGFILDRMLNKKENKGFYEKGKLTQTTRIRNRLIHSRRFRMAFIGFPVAIIFTLLRLYCDEEVFLAAGVIFLVSLAGFLMYSFRKSDEAKILITEQKELLEAKNKEILDGITYAKRIQATILPPPKVVKKYLEDSFILYLPKDIVAGDFYWMESPVENENVVLFAACDCTGHGVPGALVSVVCSNALNRTVKEFNITQPAKILDKVAELVVIDFSKDENENVQDGMDASLCALNTETGALQWAGANNPLWIIRNGELLETKANKQPIGKYENMQPFTNHNFATQKGDTIYLITDGYADQFGGEKNKKLGKAKFKELLLSIQHLTLLEQRNHLYEFHNSYRGTNEQVDDILIIGVKV